MTNELIEAMRESFETWFSDDWQHPSAVERDAVGYKLAQAQNAWTVWQAAWQAALAALREQEPAAWLITGSRAFRDTVVTSEATADRRLSERGDDGSCKVPLYAAPQPAEQPASPAPELPPDTCTNCAGTGVGGYHVHATQEDAVEALRCEACDGFGYTPAAQESEILKGERK